MSDSIPDRTKFTVDDFLRKHQQQEPITMLTAYDFPTAKALDQAGIDSILVGDSLGMVVLGYETTLPVTMEDMLHHCKAVSRGATYAFLLGDMPFLSYQASVEEAVRNAGRFLQEAGMDAVKLEGGSERIPTIRSIVAAGIPVMGHLGLTPQSVHQLGGFRAQATEASSAQRLLEDAQLLQAAGCFALVLESVPHQVGRILTETLEIPTIGIGAGSECNGQVLVSHDLLGMFERFTPRFAKRYTNLYQEMVKVFTEYKMEVERGIFPADENTFSMNEEQLTLWQNQLQ
jgi:3-methyl-2-oxobutanoate hydroxymethyltransferase